MGVFFQMFDLAEANLEVCRNTNLGRRKSNFIKFYLKLTVDFEKTIRKIKEAFAESKKSSKPGKKKDV